MADGIRVVIVMSVVGLPPQPDIPRSFFILCWCMQDVKMRAVSSTGVARRPKNDSRPDFFLHCFDVHQNQIKSPDPSPTAKARFERVLVSLARSSLYMGIAASLGIALVIEKELSSKVKDQ